MINKELQEKVYKLHCEFRSLDLDYKIKNILEYSHTEEYRYRIGIYKKFEIQQNIDEGVEIPIPEYKEDYLLDRSNEWYIEISLNEGIKIFSKSLFIDKIHEFGLDIGTIIKFEDKLLIALIEKNSEIK